MSASQEDTITGGAGSGPDEAIDQAASLQDEQPAFAGSSPDAPPISPPITKVDQERMHWPNDDGRQDGIHPGQRTATEVLDDHLREGKHGSVDRDLPRNYAQDLVTLTKEGVFYGYEGMRNLALRLRKELPDARFTYKAKVIQGRLALLEWSGESPTGAYVDDGADSYLIENGRIVAQTIHYTVKHRAR